MALFRGCEDCGFRRMLCGPGAWRLDLLAWVGFGELFRFLAGEFCEWFRGWYDAWGLGELFSEFESVERGEVVVTGEVFRLGCLLAYL